MARSSLAAPHSALILALALAVPAPAPAQIIAERVALGVPFSLFGTTPPQDSSRLFILEKTGRIRIIQDGVLQLTPFLDISTQVNFAGNEQGLLGLAFHPQYAANGFFYVYFTEGTGAGNTTVWRFQAATPDSADAGSGTPVFTVAQPFNNHNGGTIRFGHDGMLYIALGDGGSFGDPANRAQSGLDLLGKMLRIDPEGADAFPLDPDNNYAIPPDNPFVGDPLNLDEIWAFGLRNPYRWSFDRLTGDFWIGDVGQDCFEEISFHPDSAGGENYGWDVMEGPDCYAEMQFNCNQGPCGAGLVDPVHWLAHPGGSVSIVGGHVYRGSAIPFLQGQYFFAEYYSGRIWSIGFDGTSVTDTTEWTSILQPTDSDINLPGGFAEDADGELYILDTDGDIFKIVPQSTGSGIAAPAARSFGIGAVSPNPFRGTTRFTVLTDRAVDVDVSVYSATGRLVRRIHSGVVPAGGTSLEWRAADARGGELPAGVYFLRARSEGRTDSERVVLLR